MENGKCISEYELTKYLFEEFGFKGLRSEDEYIEEFSKNVEWVNKEIGINPAINQIPYENGFYTEDKKFHFLSEYFEYREKNFEIVTAKHSKALNSQFQRDENIYINPNTRSNMLKWIQENIPKDYIKYTSKIPNNILYTKSGKIINKFIKAEGENAYYEFIN